MHTYATRYYPRRVVWVLCQDCPRHYLAEHDEYGRPLDTRILINPGDADEYHYLEVTDGAKVYSEWEPEPPVGMGG